MLAFRVGFFFVVGALSAGCTQDFTIFQPTGSTSDAGGDSGGTGTLSYKCGGGSVSDCSQCGGVTQGCVYCQTSDPSVLSGVCVASGSACANTAPTGFGLCPCSTAPSCPEADQVCRNGTCRTCSESPFNNNQPCGGGGMCNSTTGACN